VVTLARPRVGIHSPTLAEHDRTSPDRWEAHSVVDSRHLIGLSEGFPWRVCSVRRHPNWVARNNCTPPCSATIVSIHSERVRALSANTWVSTYAFVSASSLWPESRPAVHPPLLEGNRGVAVGELTAIALIGKRLQAAVKPAHPRGDWNRYVRRGAHRAHKSYISLTAMLFAKSQPTYDGLLTTVGT